MQFFELMLSEKIGKMLAYTVSEKKYNRYELVEKWLGSDTYDETINFSVYLCSQAKTYILAAFEKEFENNLPSIDDTDPAYEEDLFWFGYVAAYWFFTDGTTGKDILATIDVHRMLDDYEMLHTLNVKHAISKIKEDDYL